MGLDLFQMDYVLSIEDRMYIIENMSGKHPVCSICETPTDIAWLRKQHDAPIENTMCVPCFLKKFTDAWPEMIDRLVQIGQARDFYYINKQ